MLMQVLHVKCFSKFYRQYIHFHFYIFHVLDNTIYWCVGGNPSIRFDGSKNSGLPVTLTQQAHDVVLSSKQRYINVKTMLCACWEALMKPKKIPISSFRENVPFSTLTGVICE